MATHSSVLAWRIHGQRSLAGYSPWGREESDTSERLSLAPFLGIYRWPDHLSNTGFQVRQKVTKDQQNIKLRSEPRSCDS